MRWLVLCVVVVTILVGAASRTAVCQRPSAAKSADILEEFAIGKHGRPIVLPVTFGGKTLLFAVDTGSAISIFDSSMKPKLGEAKGKASIRTSLGLGRVDVFNCPDAFVGKLSLKAYIQVTSLDLEAIRRASGKEIYGVLGIDFLKHFVVQVDFDGGTLRFFGEVSTQKERLGSPLPIAFNSENCPTITAIVGGKHEEKFVIDTGATYMAIESGLFDRMVMDEEVIPGASSALATVAGDYRAKSGKLLQMSIDGFALKGLRTDRDLMSSIGLRLLSRFLVTFDFPNRTLYLKTGKMLPEPDPPATSGLVLIQLRGKTFVKTVKPNGPADLAGIQAGDELLAIDGKSSSGLDLFDLGIQLTSRVGKKVRLRLRRNDDEFETELGLVDRYGPNLRTSKPKN